MEIINETSKALKRRERLGFFKMFVNPSVIDIGCGTNLEHLIIPTARPYDLSLGSGDATYMKDIQNGVYNTVYASHILEHIQNQEEALRNWLRICRVFGHVIISVPERDLFEKKKKLPSQFADPVHLRFYTLYEDRGPDTYSLIKLCEKVYGNTVKVVWACVNDEGYNYSLPKNTHPVGEYQIEIVLRKIK